MISHSRSPTRTGAETNERARGSNPGRATRGARCEPSRGRAHLDPKLGDLRWVRPVARDVAEMPQSRAIGCAGPIHPRQCEPRDHPSRKEGKLKARIHNRRWAPRENHERRKRHRVEEFDPPEKRARAQVQRSHERGAQDRRAVLHHAHIRRERGESQKAGDRDGESQPAADPEEKHHERSHVQSRNDQNVIGRRLLKRRDDARVHKAPVTEHHRAQHGQPFGLPGEQTVQARQQAPMHSREALHESRRRPVNQLKQFAAAQGAREINFLAREIAVQIECAGIEEIARRPCAHEGFHAVARAQERRGVRVLVRAIALPIEIEAQAAANGQRFARNFHFLEVHHIAATPGHGHRVFAQASSPAQWFARVHAPGCDKARNVVCRDRCSLGAQRPTAERGPGEERKGPRVRLRARATRGSRPEKSPPQLPRAMPHDGPATGSQPGCRRRTPRQSTKPVIS